MYKVIIVESDSTMRFMYNKMKSWGEYQFEIIDIVDDSRKLLNLLSSQDCDIIFASVRVPSVDGFEILKALNCMGINIPIVIISAYNQFSYIKQALEMGAIDYLIKPISEKSLSEVLERAKTYLIEIQQRKLSNSIITNALKSCNVLSSDVFIQNVCDFIAERLTENITLYDISYNFSMSREQFNSKFKEKSGVNFNLFFNNIKMEYAKVLISTTDMKNYEVANTLGYATPDYFTRIFKECIGITPTQYRKQFKSK